MLLAVLLGALIAAMALAMDMGRGYMQKADMKAAADAAALAGVRELPDPELAAVRALDMAARNGFTGGQNGVEITSWQHATNTNWYVVRIAKPINHLLAPIIGRFVDDVSVQSTAEFSAYIPIDITGGGVYGVNGVMTLSQFGPFAQYSYGDGVTPRWTNDCQPNPFNKPQGYDFNIEVPEDYAVINDTTMLRVEVFDPDTWNKNYGGTGSYDTYGNVNDAYPGKRIDEIRTGPCGIPTNVRNTTEYSLYAPDETPNDISDDVLIAQATYGPDDSASDMQWTTPAGFSFDISPYGAGRYRLNITATDGSSENGFNLRAGPPSDVFDPDNGTTISSKNEICINFNDSGTVTVALGEVGPEAAGKTMRINKFDTDVGALSITYQCDTLEGEWTGMLTGNGQWIEDTITVPADYTGGTWYATYVAGLQDTSVWRMWFDGMQEGRPGFVRLVE